MLFRSPRLFPAAVLAVLAAPPAVAAPLRYDTARPESIPFDPGRRVICLAAPDDDSLLALTGNGLCLDCDLMRDSHCQHEEPVELVLHRRSQGGWTQPEVLGELPPRTWMILPGPGQDLMVVGLGDIRLQQVQRKGPTWVLGGSEPWLTPAEQERLGLPKQPMGPLAVAGDGALLLGFGPGLARIAPPAPGRRTRLEWLLEPAGKAGAAPGIRVPAGGADGRVYVLDQRTRELSMVQAGARALDAAGAGSAPGTARLATLVQAKGWPEPGFLPLDLRVFDGHLLVAGQARAEDKSSSLVAVTRDAGGAWKAARLGIRTAFREPFILTPSGHLVVKDPKKGYRLYRNQQAEAVETPTGGLPAKLPLGPARPAESKAVDSAAVESKSGPSLAASGPQRTARLEGKSAGPEAGGDPGKVPAEGSRFFLGEPEIQRAASWLLRNEPRAVRIDALPDAGRQRPPLLHSSASAEGTRMHLTLQRLAPLAAGIDAEAGGEPLLTRALEATAGRTGLEKDAQGRDRFTYGLTLVLDSAAESLLEVLPGGSSLDGQVWRRFLGTGTTGSAAMDGEGSMHASKPGEDPGT